LGSFGGLFKYPLGGALVLGVVIGLIMMICAVMRIHRSWAERICSLFLILIGVGVVFAVVLILALMSLRARGEL
jgi:multisubunit Na+/H+ antiporter MnhB subunit